MDVIYMAIIGGVVAVAIAIGYMAFTGGAEGFNPITIDNLNSVLRPGVETP